MASRTHTKEQTVTKADIKKYDEDAREMFNMFDRDGDKNISVEELGKALKQMGLSFTYKEVQLAAKQMDKDKNGKIDYKEFREFLILQYKRTDVEVQAREAFKIFDKDGNGSIDMSELKYALKMLGEQVRDEDIVEMMQEADENQDGKINFNEFLAIWKRKMVEDVTE